ncbi:MAG: SemiSWEET transporter [Cyanobacteriota bacterium]|nr:SemiSWEET transporter [Cyanobacteriota bacterium]
MLPPAMRMFTSESSIRLLGYVAASLTTLSFFPQALKVLRSGDTGAISLRMYAMFTLGIALWGVYGLLSSDGPLIVANGITLVPAGFVLLRRFQRWRADQGRGLRR